MRSFPFLGQVDCNSCNRRGVQFLNTVLQLNLYLYVCFPALMHRISTSRILLILLQNHCPSAWTSSIFLARTWSASFSEMRFLLWRQWRLASSRTFCKYPHPWLCYPFVLSSVPHMFRDNSRLHIGTVIFSLGPVSGTDNSTQDCWQFESLESQVGRNLHFLVERRPFFGAPDASDREAVGVVCRES